MRRNLTSLASITTLAFGCGPISDLQLARFRNTTLLETHRYVLGEQYIEAGGIRFCYQEFGSGDPLLILPGLGTNIDYWQRNIPELAQHHRVLAVDLPGFGKSSKPDASYDLLWICDRIINFLDAKNVQRTAVMGISMGGHLGLLLALNHPDRVDKLIMVGSCGAWEEPGPLLHAAFHLPLYECIMSDHLRRNWVDIFGRLFAQVTTMTQRICDYQMAIRADRLLYRPEGAASARALRSIFYNTCRDRLSDVRQPVLLMWGVGDFIHPPSDGMYLKRHLPDAQLFVLDDANHAVMVDKPDEFNRRVLEFLRRGNPAHDQAQLWDVQEYPSGIRQRHADLKRRTLAFLRRHLNGRADDLRQAVGDR